MLDREKTRHGHTAGVFSNGNHARRSVLGRDFFSGGQRTISGGSCFHYHAYRKMIAAKMVFVGFLGEGQSKNLEEAAPKRLRLPA